MSNIIGVGQLSLMDLNDAIIAGVPPKNPVTDSLWIDESLNPPMLKKWNGDIWVDLGELDPDLSVTIESIESTLGNMSNDNIINFQERQVIKDKLTEIIGYVIADSATTMPTVATLDSSGKGGFWSVRKSARNAGIQTSDNVYDNLTTRYNNLKSYLESFTPIDAWDLRSANKDVVIEVAKATFRDRWLQYYLAVDALAEATASKLKENIDKIDVNGRNFITNGGFMINLDESTWKDYYVGNVKEIVDISAETPPMQFALHVKNTANVNGGIFTPVIFEGAVAESLIGREITLSFWLKYQNIVQGLNSTNLGRFGEIVIEGVKADNSKVYSYQRVGANNTFGNTYFSGTNMTWKKYEGTLKIEMPAGAVAIRSISFKHGLEGCKGEFWTTALKLETGSKATDWTPNPLDVEGRVTSVENKVLPDRIVQTVTSSEVYKKDIDDTKKHAETVAGAVQRDVDDLERTLDGLDREIKGTFKDGLVTESEAKAISKYINILNSEKLDVDNRYNIIYADSNLSGTPKTNLLSAKNSYNTAHNNLMKSINDTIADGRATSAESADVDSKFNSYRSALGALSTRFEEAIRTIENAKIDSVQIGGRNYIRNGNFYEGEKHWAISSSNTMSIVSGYNGGNGLEITHLSTGSVAPRQRINIQMSAGETLTMQMKVKSDNFTSFETKSGRVASQVSLLRVPSLTKNLSGGWRLYVYQYTASSDITLTNEIGLYAGETTTYTLSEIKLELGTKPTDWSPAPEDVDSAISTVQGNVDEVYRSLGSLDNEIKGTFKDGIVSEAESKAIAKYINTLNSEKLEVDNRYNIIYADSSLTGTAKTNLASAKTSYNTAHSNLITSINNAIKDGKATSAESADVDSKFTAYRTALGTLSTRIEEATRFIEQAKVNAVQVGGRNIVLNSKGEHTYNLVMEYLDVVDIMESGAEYILSFDAKTSNGTDTMYFSTVTPATNGNTFQRVVSMTPTGTYKRYQYTFKSLSGSESVNRLMVNNRTANNPNNKGILYLKNIKLEKGNKPTDWSPAPEDIDNAVSTVQDNVDEVGRSLTSLDKEVKGTFKDGIVSEAEAKAIAKYINSLDSEKSDVDNRYTIIYGESSLSGTAKSNLSSAKSAYNTAHSNLISSINNAIRDGKATTSESADVDSKFASYRSALGTLSTRLEEAIRAIETAKVDSVEVGGRNYALDSARQQTGNSIIQYSLSREKLEEIIGSQITISFDAKADGDGIHYIDSYLRDNGAAVSPITPPFILGAEYQRYSYTITMPNTKARTMLTIAIRGNTSPNSSNSGNYSVKNMKVEKGNKATDWSPAPEDVDSAIGEKVSTTVYNKKIGEVETALGKVTIKAGETEKSVNNLTGRVDTINTSLTELKVETGKISTKVTDVKTTADTAKRDIDNLEIGGRNLLRYLSNPSYWTSGGLTSHSVDGDVVSGTNSSGGQWPRIHHRLNQYENPEFSLELGATYTLSFDGKRTQAGTQPIWLGDTNGSNRTVARNIPYTEEWNRHVVTFTHETPLVTPMLQFWVNSHQATDIQTLSIRNIKLEKGNRATDYTPAPEDIDESISDKATTEDVATALQTVSEEYSTAIDDATNALSETIAQDIADMESSITTAYSTAIEQTAKDINISIGKVDERIDGTQQEITEVKSFFTFSDDGFTIGRSDSPLSINISNTRMEFRDSGTAVAYIDKQTMYIENIHTLQSFIVGNHKIEKHDDNITIIKWIG